eukprot:TRINITY_DN45_c0_g1_i7.p1 TRINITY_DN45_c0_g1~~TRINITY_DN45_c0_g1_i7.p1  ORF type:complete len:1213 (-),score=621.75 TRINITY_DN45_c0_g1_i7:124-3762(-)
MGRKNILLFVFLLLLASPFAWAQEDGTEGDATPTEAPAEAAPTEAAPAEAAPTEAAAAEAAPEAAAPEAPKVPTPQEALTQGVANVKEAAIENVKDNLKETLMAPVNDLKNQATAAVNEAVDNAKNYVVAKGTEVLDSCANGEGDLASFQQACQLLKKGLEIGEAVAQVVDIEYDRKKGILSGHLDLSDLFGGVPPFSFKIIKKGNNIGAVFTPDTPIRVNIGRILRKIVPGGFGFGPVFDQIVSAAGFDKIEFQISEVAFNINPYGFRISGIADFLGNTPFNLLLAKSKGWVFALDVSITEGVIESALDKALGSLKKIVCVFVIEQLDISLATNKLSWSEAPALKWDGAPGGSLEKGFALNMKARFDENSENPLGKFLAGFMKGTWELNLAVTTGEFKLALKLPEIIFSSRAKLAESDLHLVAGFSPPKMEFGVSATFEFKPTDDLLRFTAELNARMHDPSVEAGLSLIGTWHNAFGVTDLSIGNLVGKVAIGVRAPWILMLMLGGEIQYGADNNDPIKGSGYFRFDLENPMENYYYVNLGRLVVGQLFKHVFRANVALPGFLAESGFPEGCQASFALKNQQLPNGDEAPAGYRYKGKFQFLGFWAKVDILLWVTQFRFKVEFSSFKIGSTIQVSRSKEDMSNGPLAHVEGSVDPFHLKVHIEGYIKLFLFEAYVQIIVSPTMFHFQVKAPIFYIFDAEIEARASLTGNLADAGFSFQAKIGTGSTRDKVLEFIRDFREKALGDLEKAKRETEEAQKKVFDTANGVCNGGKDCGFGCGANFLETHGLKKNADRAFDISFLEAQALDLAHNYKVIDSMSLKQFEDAGVVVRDEDLKLDDTIALIQLQEFAKTWHMIEDHEAMQVLDLLNEHTEEERIENLIQTADEYFLLAIQSASYTAQETENHLLLELSDTALDQLTEEQYGPWDKVTNAFKSAGNAIKSGFQQAGQKISQGVNKAVNTVKTGFQSFGQKVSQGVNKAVNQIRTGVNNAVNQVRTGVTRTFNQIKQGATNTFNQIKAGATRTFNQVKTGVTNGFNQMKTGLTNGFNKFKAGATNAFNQVKNFAVNTGNKIADFGKTVGRGIVTAGCAAGHGLCTAGCKTGYGVVTGAAYTMEAGKGFLTGLQEVVKAFTSVVDMVLSNIDFSIEFGGSLSVEEFSFNCGFSLRIAGWSTSFKLNINLKFGGISKLASTIFDRVKDYIIEKVPDIKKFIKV